MSVFAFATIAHVILLMKSRPPPALPPPPTHTPSSHSIKPTFLSAPLPKVENLTISNITPYGFRVSWGVKHQLPQDNLTPSSGGFSHFHIVVTDSGWLLKAQEFTVPGNQSHLDIGGLITGIGYEVRLTGVSESGLLSRPLTAVAVTGTTQCTVSPPVLLQSPVSDFVEATMGVYVYNYYNHFSSAVSLSQPGAVLWYLLITDIHFTQQKTLCNKISLRTDTSNSVPRFDGETSVQYSYLTLTQMTFFSSMTSLFLGFKHLLGMQLCHREEEVLSSRLFLLTSKIWASTFVCLHILKCVFLRIFNCW